MLMKDLYYLNQIRPKIVNSKMSIKTTYKFSRLFKEVEEQANFFDTTLSNIIAQYGQRDEKGEYVLTEDKNGVMIQEDKKNECLAKINELNNLEINLNYVPAFNLDELEFLDLTVDEMTILMPFIEEE